MASEPPDGISSVVSTFRVVMPGTVVPAIVTLFSGASSETSVITFRLMRPSDSTTGVNARLTPNVCHEYPAAPPTVFGGVGIRKLAAGDESGAFAGDRGQGRLGQRVDHAGLLHGLQRGRHRREYRRADWQSVLGGAPLIGNGLVVLKLSTEVP